MAGSISFGYPSRYSPTQLASGKIPVTLSGSRVLSSNYYPSPGVNQGGVYIGNPYGQQYSPSQIASGKNVILQQLKGPAGYDATNTTPTTPSGSTNITPTTTSDPQYEAQKQSQLALYNQGIGNTNSALDRLIGQQGVGQSNIDTAYNSAYNQLALTRARGQQGYDTTTLQAQQDYDLAKTQGAQAYEDTKAQTAQDYVGAKNTIGSQAGTSLNSLLRLLGSRGAGGSSAALFNAPQAVARQATLQRNDVGQAYGRNQQALDTGYNQNVAAQDTNYQRNKNALDTGWQNYLSDYDNSITNLGSQRTNNQAALEAAIKNNRATLLQNLANLSAQRDVLQGQSGTTAVQSTQPYLDQANQLIAQADALGRQVPVSINANPTAFAAPTIAPTPLYQAPTLDSYTVNPNAAPMYQGQNQGANDFITPYLSMLMGKKQLGIA